VDAALHEAMTMHQKNEEGSYVGRLSNAKNEVKDFYISPHLFGNLAQHKGGLELLAQETPLLRKYLEVRLGFIINILGSS
jgi:rapamycin-insensitive companion of mTOR